MALTVYVTININITNIIIGFIPIVYGWSTGPLTQSIGHPLNQSTNQSIDQSSSKPLTEQSIIQPTTQSNDRSINCSVMLGIEPTIPPTGSTRSVNCKPAHLIVHIY